MDAHWRGVGLVVLLCSGCMAAPGDGGEEVERQAAALVAPNTCFIQAYDHHYVTAMDGGGRTTDVIHTNISQPNNWETFTLVDSGDGAQYTHYGIQTCYGEYLTAVGGGGRTSDVIHSDATQLLDWEKFTLAQIGPNRFAIQTIDGHYLTAVGSGGRTTNTIHSDATSVGTWETFTFTCSNQLGIFYCEYPTRDCGGICVDYTLPCP